MFNPVHYMYFQYTAYICCLRQHEHACMNPASALNVTWSLNVSLVCRIAWNAAHTTMCNRSNSRMCMVHCYETGKRKFQRVCIWWQVCINIMTAKTIYVVAVINLIKQIVTTLGNKGKILLKEFTEESSCNNQGLFTFKLRIANKRKFFCPNAIIWNGWNSKDSTNRRDSTEQTPQT